MELDPQNRSLTTLDLWREYPTDSFHRTQGPVPNAVRPPDPVYVETLHTTRSKYPSAKTNYPPHYPPAGRGAMAEFQVPGLSPAAAPVSAPPSAHRDGGCGSGVCGVPGARGAVAAAADGGSTGAEALLDSLNPGGREDLGRSTWHLLHTLAAQLPDRPSAQQQRDVRDLVLLLTRVYPCGECARHFADIVAREPPQTQTRHDFAQWLCRAHNVVNRRLDKPAFPCQEVDSHWGAVGCEGGVCSLHPPST